MLAHAGAPAFAEAYRRSDDPDAALAWIARGATRPGRAGDGETLVAHASPA